MSKQLAGFLSVQVAAIVRRSVARHSHLRNDAFYAELQRDLAAADCEIVRRAPERVEPSALETTGTSASSGGLPAYRGTR